MNLTTLLVLSSIALLCNCDNFKEICYDGKVYKNMNRLIHMYRMGTAGTAQQIRKNGYPVENHAVRTNDGYILDIQRIPHGLTNGRRGNAAPVLILHGIGSSSTSYASMPNGIAYALANEGYDVWLGNFRSSFENTYHITYSQVESKYWDFGFEEYALDDTPAMIDHILLTTNQTRLSIISMSMSTTTTSVMLSLNPDLNNKVSRHIAMAPVLHLDYSVNVFPLQLISKLSSYNILSNTDSFVSILNKMSFYLAPVVCSPYPFISLCQLTITSAFGYSPGRYGVCIGAVLPGILRGVSIKSIQHFSQVMTKNRLMRFDYGLDENLERYGSKMPPIIDLTRITAPTSLIYSANDPIANPLNVALLAREMKTAKVVLLKEMMFTHLDFVIAAFDNNIMNRLNSVILENIRLP